MDIKQGIMRYRLLLFILLAFAVLSNCAVKDKVFRSFGMGGQDKKLSEFPDYDNIDKEPSKIAKRPPWEIWPYGRGLDGKPLKSLNILQGDEHLKNGLATKALEHYLAAKQEVLTPAEVEALVIRIASTELLLDRPDNALQSMSQFFRYVNKTEDEVDARFSLIFAYAYGRKGDLDQSFAWFSRIHRMSAGRGGMADAAREGTRLLMRSLSADDFQFVVNTWSVDSFVNSLISKERLRRQSPGYQEVHGAKSGHFWEEDYGHVALERSDFDSYQGEGKMVGVLLPLSGKYSRLGNSTKNGIELALLGQGPDGIVKPIFRDTSGDTMQANAQIRELIEAQGVNVVIGPLLSSVAASVSSIARDKRASAVVFSKRSNFLTGEGIFRLGPTIPSQVLSLIKACTRKLALRKYAVVYPNTLLGKEFSEVFQEMLRHFNISASYITNYERNDDNALVAIAKELESLDIQAVFFPDSIQAAARFYGSFSEGAKRRIKLLGTAAWNSPTELANSSAVLEGAVFVSPFFSQSPKAVIAKFNQAYRTKYSQQPDFLAAQGFDAATLVIAAINKQLETDMSFYSALRSIDSYEGLTGVMRVANDGEVYRDFYVVELRHGKIIELQEIQLEEPRKIVKPSYIMRGNDRVEKPFR